MKKIKSFKQFESFSDRVDEELSPKLRYRAASKAKEKADGISVGRVSSLKKQAYLNQAAALREFPPYIHSQAKRVANMIAVDLFKTQPRDASIPVSYSLKRYKSDYSIRTNFKVTHPSYTNSELRLKNEREKHTLIELETDGRDFLEGYGMQTIQKLKDSTIKALDRLLDMVAADTYDVF